MFPCPQSRKCLFHLTHLPIASLFWRIPVPELILLSGEMTHLVIRMAWKIWSLWISFLCSRFYLLCESLKRKEKKVEGSWWAHVVGLSVEKKGYVWPRSQCSLWWITSELYTFSIVAYLDPSRSIHFLWNIVLYLINNQNWDWSHSFIIQIMVTSVRAVVSW